MIIDAHAHYHPRRYNEALNRMGINGRPMEPHPDTDDAEHIEKRLEMMEAAGVGLQVLSPAAGRARGGWPGAALTARCESDLEPCRSRHRKNKPQ